MIRQHSVLIGVDSSKIVLSNNAGTPQIPFAGCLRVHLWFKAVMLMFLPFKFMIVHNLVCVAETATFAQE